MRIDLENLEGGGGEFAHGYLPADLNPIDDRVRLAEPATVNGKVMLAGTEVVVKGHIETRAQLECDRCLKQIELPVDTDFVLEYITGREYESSTVVSLTADDLSVSVFDGEAIDVDEIVKEQILLAVPTRTLCSADCKGICPDCGIDRNTGDCSCATNDVDPRWEVLKNLTSGES